MTSFLVGDIVDFCNPATGTTARTKISQSSATGKVVLDGISDQWLNASAVSACVKLVYRGKVGDTIEYVSTSGQVWRDAAIPAFRDTARLT